jgi:DNA-directed RNA polymerase subunit omega
VRSDAGKRIVSMVMLASRRARQLARPGAKSLVPEENDKPTVIALREIAEGLVSHEMLDAQETASDDERLDIPFGLSDEGNREL